jgi:ABC-type branched-subunit amino acid transport system ATPase component
VLAITDDAVVLERGRVVHAASSAVLMAQPVLLDRFLAVGVER